MGEWSALLKPIIDKFKLAADFEMKTCWDAEGSAAMAMLLTQIGEKLDEARQLELCAPPTNEEFRAINCIAGHPCRKMS
jgi:hypothetical protein